jgi:hypothetical protein
MPQNPLFEIPRELQLLAVNNVERARQLSIPGWRLEGHGRLAFDFIRCDHAGISG